MCIASLLHPFLKLLEKKKRVQLKDMGEDLECLCQIMRTVGPRLDHAKAKVTNSFSNNLSKDVSRLYMIMDISLNK